MFARLERLLKSMWNSLMESFEDPEIILQNNIRDMRNQIPKLNEGLARMNATVILLTDDIENADRDEATLLTKIKLAKQSKEDEYGIQLTDKLIRLRELRDKNETALTSAKQGYQNMVQVRDVQLRNIQGEIDKMKTVIKEARLSKMKGDIADLTSSFTANSISNSNEEMLTKIKEKSAFDESKFEITQDSTDIKILKLEEQAEKEKAKELYSTLFVKDTKNVKKRN